MRRLVSLALFLIVALAGCADAVQPPASPTPLATAAPSSSPTLARTPPTTTPEPAPSLQPTLTVLPAAGSPWPSFLRELDFGITAGNSYGPRALAVHSGLDRIYARTRGQQGAGWNQITVLNRSTGQVLDLAPVGPDSYGDGELVVDSRHDRVYAVNSDENSASILDARTLEPQAQIEGVVRLALDPSSGRVYVAGLGGLRSLDAQGDSILRQADVAYAPHFLLLSVDPVRQRVFLAWQEADSHYLAQYDAGTLQELAVTPLPGRPDALVPDPNRALVYLTLNDGERNLLWAVDDTGQRAKELILGEWSQKTHLALDPGADLLYLGTEQYDKYGITFLDLQTWREIAGIPLDLAPNTLLWDAQSGRLLVSHTYADRIRIVDTEAGETAAIFPTALDLVDLAVDPARGSLYVTDSAGRLHILDSETDETLAIVPGGGRIALDSPHGRIYTGGPEAEHLQVLDANTLQQMGLMDTSAKPVADTHYGDLYLVQNGIYLASLETMTITAAISDTLPQVPGFSPNPSAVDAVVDPGSGRLFAIINNGTPGSNSGTYLYVYEPETYERVLTDTERSPVYVDIHPATGHAYVSRIHLAGRSTSLLEDGRHYTARLEAVFGALRVDPGLKRLYLSASGNEEGYLLVLDAENLDVLGSVPIPGDFALHALDPQRHLLYLTASDGRVQVWSATGGRQSEPHEPVSARPSVEDLFKLFRGPQDATIFTGSLYRSDSQGRSWQRISAGLPRRGVQQLTVSPSFTEDSTLFAAMLATDEGLGIWKSSDGGRSWRIASRGLTDLAVTDLAISPSYAENQTLFATARKGGLFRSSDGGESWVRLTDRYYPSSTYPRPPGGVYLSPTFGRAGTNDRTLFVAHEGLYRSTDGGDTWRRTLPDVSSLALSPDFATDQTVFGWSAKGGIFRSIDAGETWQPASAGLDLSGYGWGRVILSPDYPSSRTVYFIWTTTSPDAPPLFFRSRDAAQSWERLAEEAPQAATPVELSADGAHFLALDEDALLRRWVIEDLEWQPVGQPSVDELELYELVLSPDFTQDQTLFGLSEGSGVLRSGDAGLTWENTEFPLRVTSGLPLNLVVVTPDRLFVGTPLGLYRSVGGDAWSRATGGLPGGVSISSPQLGTDGTLSVLAGDASDREPQRIFLSTDDGQTWTQPMPPLPQAVIGDDLRLSPALATDWTAFIASKVGTPLRTSNRNDWQPFGPPGKWDLSSLQLSPSFDQDRLLIIRLQDNSLWRSTDGGDNWVRSEGPWGREAPIAVTHSTGYSLDAVTFSPAFAEDGVILTQAGTALYRSTNGGMTWLKVLDLAPLAARATFSPDYPRDGTIYLLQGSALRRSTDGGQNWQTMPPPPWGETDEVELLPSPTFSADHILLAWSRTGQVYQSQTDGQSWHDISHGLPATSIRQVSFSPGYASDALLYLVPTGPGLYKRVGDSPWLLTSVQAPTPTPTRWPAPTSTPRPVSTPQPQSCTIQPDLLQEVWDEVQPRLGCPEEAATPVTLAEQPFEHGRMIWDSSTREIYVLLESSLWQTFDDTFTEGIDPAYDPALPPPPRQPQRGFGKVWRERLGGAQAAIGWALDDERLADGLRQRFQQGLLVWTAAAGATAPGTTYLLYDNGTWQAVLSLGPQ